MALALCLWLPHGVSAHERTVESAGKAQIDDHENEIDSEHIFGVTEGSDTGDAGEKELELESFGRFGKRVGSFAATSTALLFKYSPTENFRLAPFISLASHDISNVPGLQDVDRFTVQGAGVSLRYRALDRERAPFGLTFSASPQRNRVDEITGLAVEQYSVDFAALLDKELVPNRLFAALNLIYEPEWTRLRTSGEWERDSTVGLGMALSVQIAQGLFVGAEVRYLRKYEDIGLINALLGEALFLGPSAYVKLSKQWFASAAWNVQVAGHAAGEPGPLDLTNFERHDVLFRLGTTF